jgi:CheY-like chemotaxis protein
VFAWDVTAPHKFRRNEKNQMTGEERKAQILVVEDNPADVELLRYALGSADLSYDLTVIDNGGEALALMQQRGKYAHTPAPDLVILDLNLPTYDGMEILEAIRSNPAFAGIPIAVLSSSSSLRDRSKIEAFAVNLYITKPSELDEYLGIGMILKLLLDENKSSV